MKIQLFDIDKVIPYISNPRKNLNVDKVAGSIREFGFQQPIVKSRFSNKGRQSGTKSVEEIIM